MAKISICQTKRLHENSGLISLDCIDLFIRRFIGVNIFFLLSCSQILAVMPIFPFYENDKNSPVVIVVTFFGMLTRYLVVNFIYILIGKKPKKFLDYSRNFNQILYNILILFGIFFLFLFYQLYLASQE